MESNEFRLGTIYHLFWMPYQWLWNHETMWKGNNCGCGVVSNDNMLRGKFIDPFTGDYELHPAQRAINTLLWILEKQIKGET